MNLIFLGAPGAGKGTQAEVVSEHFHIPTISTGNIIRAALKNETPMGLQAKSYIEAGRLVPDDVVIGIIKDRLSLPDCAGGFILDGFPRTIPQAEALDQMGVHIDLAIDLEVPDEIIAGRMAGRRVCKECGNSYHVEYKPPKTQGVCDVCGGELVRRKDDEPETVLARLGVYHAETEPLISYYDRQKKLVVIEGQAKVADTTALTLRALEEIA